MDKLEDLGLFNITLVIWTTGHNAIASHGSHFDKASYIHDEMIRVPLAECYHGKIKAGQRVTYFVSNFDLAPTILEQKGQKMLMEAIFSR